MELTTCPNCYYSINGNFCGSCGQQTLHRYDPGLHDVIHDAVHEFFHVDGKIFSTLKAMLFKPGLLTLSFFSGRRARYVNPLRLYLTMSLLYFLLSAVTHPPKLNIIIEGGTGAKIDKGLTEKTDNPEQDWLLAKFNSLPGFKNLGTRIEKHPDEFVHLFRKGFPKAVFILVPIFALLLQASYGFRRKYPQYLYFSLHYYSAFFGMLILSLLLDPWIDSNALVLIWAAVYLGTATKRVWGGSTRAAVIRTAGVSIAYGVFFVIALLLVMSYAAYNLSPA